MSKEIKETDIDVFYPLPADKSLADQIEYDVDDDKEVLNMLSRGFPIDRSLENQIKIAKSINTDIDTFFKLINDESIEETVKMYVANNLNAPQEILAVLAKKTFSIKLFVAQNISCSEKTLLELSLDNHKFIRLEIAKNKACSIELLEQLAKDTDPEVRKFALKSISQLKTI